MRLMSFFFCCMVLTSCKTVTLPDNVVATDQGVARGVVSDGITAFLGIEYAEAKRWKLPTDGPVWQGEKTFDTLGPACPQDGQTVMVEDCLFLNVFTPEGTKKSEKLPVLFWIHGGGLRNGRGDARVSTFAQDDVIVVSINYRLGVLGFHDWAGWSEDDPRNFGQADMVKALEWTHANIKNFGGDPENVTIAGHSAGGMGVQLMMVDQRAKGLFRRAMSDAGYGTWPFPKAYNPTDEERTRIRYAGLEQHVSAKDLVARTPHFHLPYIGGSDLPRQPIEVFKTGDQAPVPYMSGANSMDGYGTLQGAGYEIASFLSRYKDIDGIRTEYAADFALSEDLASMRLFGDMRYVYAASATSRAVEKSGQPAYLFYYDEPMHSLPGTPHGGHYASLLAGSDTPFKRYMLAFIKTGTPTPDGLPKWEAHSDTSDKWMIFTPEPDLTQSLTDRMEILEGLVFPAPDRNP